MPIDLPTIISWLSRSAAFQGVSPEALEEVAGEFQPGPKITSGSEVMHQGDAGGDIYLLASGALAVTSDSDGTVTHLGEIAAGEVFGELSALAGGHRQATVTATEDSELLVLSLADFRTAFRHHPELAESLLRSLQRYSSS